MFRKACVTAVLMMIAACAPRPAAVTQPAPIAPQSPHSMKVTQKLPTKLNFEHYLVDVTFKNTYDKPMWFITRRAGEMSLNDEGKFYPGGLKDPIKLERYYGYEPDGGLNSVTVIKFLSYKKRQGGFRAVLLPPHGELTIHDWDLTVYEGREAKFEVIESAKLMVNRDVPIEEWAGYLVTAPVMLEAYNLSSEAASATQPATAPAGINARQAETLRLYARRAETDFYKNPLKMPKDELYMIQADEVKRYVSPISGYVYVAPKEEENK